MLTERCEFIVYSRKIVFETSHILLTLLSLLLILILDNIKVNDVLLDKFLEINWLASLKLGGFAIFNQGFEHVDVKLLLFSC